MRLDIHTIYRQIFKIWRQKRMKLFIDIINPTMDNLILDVGGSPNTWTGQMPIVKQIDCLNIRTIEWDEKSNRKQKIKTLVGDGCALQAGNCSYDIVFSNSVIEHVGSLERQRMFASEIRRVGGKLWVQTPAYECPWEPHFLAPFAHWLPEWARYIYIRWFTPWGWIERPSHTETLRVIRDTQLLTKNQVQELFPDCTVITERLFGILPKSYIAYRTKDPPSSKTANETIL